MQEKARTISTRVKIRNKKTPTKLPLRTREISENVIDKVTFSELIIFQYVIWEKLKSPQRQKDRYTWEEFHTKPLGPDNTPPPVQLLHVRYPTNGN